MMEATAAPVRWAAEETVRGLRDPWSVGESRGEMPGGGQSITIMTLGYDPQKERYVGTFVGSMMTNLWVYERSLDESGNVLTLDTEGPGMKKGTMAKYKDVIEFKTDDLRTLTSVVQGEDGQWTRIMTADYRRKSQRNVESYRKTRTVR